jgi:hypothetical protein
MSSDYPLIDDTTSRFFLNYLKDTKGNITFYNDFSNIFGYTENSIIRYYLLQSITRL